MFMLPCTILIDLEFERIDRQLFTHKITLTETIRRRSALLDILSDAGLIPDEPKEAR